MGSRTIACLTLIAVASGAAADSTYAPEKYKDGETGAELGRAIGNATGLTEIPHAKDAEEMLRDAGAKAAREQMERNKQEKARQDTERAAERARQKAEGIPQPASHPTPSDRAKAAPATTSQGTNERDPGGAHGGGRDHDNPKGERNDAPHDAMERASRKV